MTVSRRAAPAGDRPDLAVGHRLGGYLDTAALVDASDEPSLRAWRAGLAPFLAAAGESPAPAPPPVSTGSEVIVTGARVAARGGG